jgi:hypothetical protein
MKWTEAYERTGWTIVVPVKLIHAVGAKGAILLAQLFYWRGKERNPEGWVYKTKLELEHETGLSRHEQNTAVEELKKKRVLETRYDRLDHRLYYRICTDTLDAIMEGDFPSEIRDADFGKSDEENAESPGEIHKADFGKSGIRTSRNPETGVPEKRDPDFESQENTSEITKETTTTNAGAAPKAKGIRNLGNVVVASFGADQKTEDPNKRQQVHSLVDGFGLTKGQEEEVMRFVQEQGMPYVLEKVAIVRSKDRDNAAGALLKALRDNWPAPVSLKKAKPAAKPKRAPTEPEMPAPTEDFSKEEKLWRDATKEQRAAWLADPSFKFMRKPKEGEAPGRLFLSILRFVLASSPSK